MAKTHYDNKRKISKHKIIKCCIQYNYKILYYTMQF